MNEASATFEWANVSEDFALFRTLSSEQRLTALNAMVRLDLVRGEMLVAQGGPSDSLFLVLHGALAVCRNGELEPIAELRAGELVGEIGFFANVPRTANVDCHPRHQRARVDPCSLPAACQGRPGHC